VPGEGGVAPEGGGGADPEADRRRAGGGIRRDDAAVRSGTAGENKYAHGAFTELHPAFWLGSRSLDSIEDAGILPAFGGIVVSDRYQDYSSSR
jgi:hypothetical protein